MASSNGLKSQEKDEALFEPHPTFLSPPINFILVSTSYLCTSFPVKKVVYGAIHKLPTCTAVYGLDNRK